MPEIRPSSILKTKQWRVPRHDQEQDLSVSFLGSCGEAADDPSQFAFSGTKMSSGYPIWKSVFLPYGMLWLGVVVFSLLFPGSADAQPLQSGEAAVVGTHLTRDGHPWIPHGFHQIAFAVAPGEFPFSHLKFFQIAANNYTPDEYLRMKEEGADSVRIQVAQNGIDPQGQFFSPDFRERVIGAIRASRKAGLTVIVCIQNEKQTGEKQKRKELPGDATRRVWRELAPVFGRDRGVLFELFNEPRIGKQTDSPPPPEKWVEWKAAFDRTIGLVRSLGAGNVIVADGLEFGEELSGAPQLDDPLHQVAYAAHPYALKVSDQKPGVWDTKFGFFSAKAPVIISEWSVAYYCDDETPQCTVAFLQYLQKHGIGLEAAAWDWQPPKFGSYNYDFPLPKISTFLGPDGKQLICLRPPRGGGPAGYGAGKTIQYWFKNRIPPNEIK
jgi:endoglucanase